MQSKDISWILVGLYKKCEVLSFVKTDTLISCFLSFSPQTELSREVATTRAV